MDIVRNAVTATSWNSIQFHHFDWTLCLFPIEIDSGCWILFPLDIKLEVRTYITIYLSRIILLKYFICYGHSVNGQDRFHSCLLTGPRQLNASTESPSNNRINAIWKDVAGSLTRYAVSAQPSGVRTKIKPCPNLGIEKLKARP